VIDITYPNVESAPLGILRDQEGDLLVKRESEQIAWLRTSGNWRALPRSWYPTLVGIRLPLRLVAPLPAELTDEALRAAAEGRTAERVEPYPEVGDRVRPEDLARLPVGAVVDTRDGTGAPLIVRGPAGWGWGNACKGERLPDSPQWGGSISSGAMSHPVGDKAVLVGLGLEGARGRAFDEGLAAQGYQPAIAAGAGAAAAAQVDADGRVAAPTPAPAPAAAPTPTALRPGDPLSKWEDLPDGGVAVDKAGDVAVRIGDRRGWAKIGLRLPLSSPWRQMLDTPFPLSRDNARDSRFVGVVPAPVTIERVRALVEGTPLPSPGQPAKREPSAAELCRQARDRRVAALRRALAAAEERLAEVAEVWTVTASGGITRRTAGRGSRPAGVVCSVADMPGGDKAAKRAEARRRVAERDERRAAAEAEVARLRAALYPGPTSGRTFLDVGGARVEVSPTTTAAEVAIALGLAGVSARASGNVLTVDLEGSLAAGQVSIQTFEA